MATSKPVQPSYADFETWKVILDKVLKKPTPEQIKAAKERSERCRRLYAKD